MRGESGPGIRAASQVAITLAAAGPFDHAMKGLLVRNGWAGHGALAGFTAVELAAAGIGGDATSALGVLERGFGYPLDEHELRAEHARWAIHDGYHKRTRAVSTRTARSRPPSRSSGVGSQACRSTTSPPS